MAKRESVDGKMASTAIPPEGMTSFDSDNLVPGSQHSTGNSPVFNTWTQFSGMPTHNVSESAGTFAWDVFTPNGNLSYGASLGEVDPEVDFLTAYQNYLAASQQLSSELNTSDNVELPSQTGFNFHEASQEGKELYNDAMGSWNSFQTYDPFGTADPLPKTQSSDHKKAEKSKAHNSSNKKPTYCDIAKTLKTKPIQHQTGKDKEEVDAMPRRLPDPVVKPFKPIINRRPHISRPHNRGHAADDMESTVLPDSKYGLDQFEEVFAGSDGTGKQSDSLESLPTLTRKGSTSSMSSGTSGIEETHFGSRSSGRFPDDRCHSNSDGFDGGFAGTTKSSNKPFFDARRIFQGKDKRSSSCSSSTGASGSTVLNNGKPAFGSKSSSSHRKTTDYINNDLRDSKKRTNHNSQRRDTDSKKHENLAQNGKVDRKSRYSSCQETDANAVGQNGEDRNPMFLHTTFDLQYIDEWISITCEKLKAAVSFLWSSFVTFILLLFGIILYLVSGSVHVIGIVWTKCSHFVKTRLLKKYFADSGSWHDRKHKIGLEENITLPSTGDEAMQRLLSCKGKDPYSILGLRCDACDDDIRKYYRKQAVLVHPDKNKQPGAEEAFKILGHAFELIGEPEKRRNYDFEATEVEVVMKDLLTKLQEAANMMRCDNCGGKHKRVPVDRPWYCARFCKRCNIRHSAKEGDVWAETSVFGFLWHYYACMDGQIYDITEWVSCKKDFFKHMQASAHHVFYRIATEGNRSNSSHQRSGEADLEDLINHLFHQAMHTDGSGNQWQQPQSPASTSTQNSSNWSSTSGTGNSNKKSRRKKKRH